MREELRHRGRIAQTFIYFGKFIRMFAYQNDWKVLPISALIAAVVTFVVGGNMFRTQEGTKLGVFALVCVCVWNGLFNSIQVVCREREIVKREHRAGLHISAYVAAHNSEWTNIMTNLGFYWADQNVAPAEPDWENLDWATLTQKAA